MEKISDVSCLHCLTRGKMKGWEGGGHCYGDLKCLWSTIYVMIQSVLAYNILIIDMSINVALQFSQEKVMCTTYMLHKYMGADMYVQHIGHTHNRQPSTGTPKILCRLQATQPFSYPTLCQELSLHTSWIIQYIKPLTLIAV